MVQIDTSCSISQKNQESLYRPFHRTWQEKTFLTAVLVYVAYLERLREGQEGPPNRPIKPRQFHQGHKKIEMLDRTHMATSIFTCMAEITRYDPTKMLLFCLHFNFQ